MGPREAMRSARACVWAASWSRGKTRLTRPARRAASASSVSPRGRAAAGGRRAAARGGGGGGAAGGGRGAVAGLRQREDGVVGAEPDVGSEGELQAGAPRLTLDGGEHRTGQIGERGQGGGGGG